MTSIRYYINLVEARLNGAESVRRDPWGWVDATAGGVSYDHSAIPPKVYHGTTAARWRKRKRGASELHVAVESGAAAEFARQWVKYDGATDPIVVEFKLNDFLHLPGVAFGADHDFLELADRIAGQRGIDLRSEPSWRDSIDFYAGKFTIDGFMEAHKALGTVIALSRDAAP